MRTIIGKKDNGKQAESTNTIGRFGTDILTQFIGMKFFLNY
jgi:hypothetical protein